MKFFLSAVFSLAVVAAQAQFLPGDLAVVRVGDGTTTLGGLGNNVSVDDFSILGVQAFANPIPQTGNTPFSLTGNASAEGALTLSQDGTSLVLAGYQTPHLSSGTLATSAASAVPRTIAQLSAAGSISFPVASTTAFSANSFRGAVTDGANNYWAVGVGTGMTYMGNNAPAATIETAQTTLRVPNIVNGNLFFSTASTIFSVAGEPQSGTTAPTAIITTTGTGTGTVSAYDFAFNPSMTLAYVADDRTTATGGGIQRWDLVSGVWVYSYTLNTGTSGARGLAVNFATGTIYATTAEASNNRLVSIVDAGVASVETDLAFAGTLRAFRGLDFAPVAVPEPSVLALLGLGMASFVARRARNK